MNVFAVIWLLFALFGIFGSWYFGDASLAFIGVVGALGIRVETLFKQRTFKYVRPRIEPIEFEG